MNERQIFLVKAALAALSKNATYDADVIYAKRCLREAVEATEQIVTLDDPNSELTKEQVIERVKESLGRIRGRQ